MCNAHQLLNEAVWKVPTQHIRYQKRLVEWAPARGTEQNRQRGVGIEQIRDVSLVEMKRVVAMVTDMGKEQNVPASVMTKIVSDGALTEAGSGCLAGRERREKYTESECC